MGCKVDKKFPRHITISLETFLRHNSIKKYCCRRTVFVRKKFHAPAYEATKKFRVGERNGDAKRNLVSGYTPRKKRVLCIFTQKVTSGIKVCIMEVHYYTLLYSASHHMCTFFGYMFYIEPQRLLLMMLYTT